MTKKLTVFFHFFLIIFLFILSTFSFVYPQSAGLLGINYISPKPGSIYNSSSENIIIKVDRNLDRSKSYNSLFKVYGSKSGKISGEIIFSDDNKTLIFKPYNKFKKSEKVTIDFSNETIFI